LWNKNEHIDTISDNLTAKNITSSGNIDISGNIRAKSITTINDIGTWDGKSGFVATNSYMDVHGGPKNIRTAIGFGTIDNTTWGGDWAPQDLTITAKNVNTTGGINSQGVITAKKFVSSDGSSALGPLSNEAIQNIGSVYNNNNFRATDITATGNLAGITTYTNDLNVNNNLATKGTIYTRDLNVDNNLATKGTVYTNDLNVANNLATKNTIYTTDLNVNNNLATKGTIFANDVQTNSLHLTDRICLKGVCKYSW